MDWTPIIAKAAQGFVLVVVTAFVSCWSDVPIFSAMNESNSALHGVIAGLAVDLEECEATLMGDDG